MSKMESSLVHAVTKVECIITLTQKGVNNF